MNAPHVLCVNPWIHDFAAFDFWAKPLGLLQLAAILRKGGLRVSYLDCVDRFHPKAGNKIKNFKDGRGPFRKREIVPPQGLEHYGKRFSRYGIEPDWFMQDLNAIEKPDLVFVTSFMTYWASGVSETISVIKTVFPDVPVVLGGIYATLCPEHARLSSHADEVVTGSGEEKLGQLIKAYTGFPFSPEIDNTNLDSYPWPALDMVSRLLYAPVLTSRGCPFSCSYCASSFLETSLRRRTPGSVFREIQHWHSNYDVQHFAFYDDALLIDPEHYILPLLEKLLASGMHLNFHTPNALHIREITPAVADMMFSVGFKTIRLGLEVFDFSSNRQNDVKVKETEFFRAVENLKKAGFQSSQIGAYLLCALPGQDLGDVENSVLSVKRYGIQPVLAYYTPIPHTPMWEKAVAHSRFDLLEDPVFSNNALFPCLEDEVSIKKISQLKKNTK